MAKKIEHTATTRHMTLDELSAFVADAYGSGAVGTEPVHATVTLGGKLRTAHVTVPTDPANPQANGYAHDRA
ncbi:hypothetical protein [Streptomyces sp. NRRL F-5135]|uniref:hypothetical protein n=1 Tax=Streptomyces sp. NRRL F-5135 TaxID=1463858 RepID=UPI0004C65B59|nr:hypothetical protein [Streptomyces sp. NRRL F-5135]